MILHRINVFWHRFPPLTCSKISRTGKSPTTPYQSLSTSSHFAETLLTVREIPVLGALSLASRGSAAGHTQLSGRCLPTQLRLDKSSNCGNWSKNILIRSKIRPRVSVCHYQASWGTHRYPSSEKLFATKKVASQVNEKKRVYIVRAVKLLVF